MEKGKLEEAAENHLQKWRLLNNIHLSNILHAERCKNDFIAGAKWQAERMCSEEEKELMIKIFHSYWFENNPEHEDNLKEWELSKKLFEQFKNK